VEVHPFGAEHSRVDGMLLVACDCYLALRLDFSDYPAAHTAIRAGRFYLLFGIHNSGFDRRRNIKTLSNTDPMTKCDSGF
jgi:hypothetical protein